MVLDRVKHILAEQLGIDEEDVTTDSLLINDLGADSLDIIELVMALEEEFDIEIEDEDAEDMNTVGDIVNYINEKC